MDNPLLDLIATGYAMQFQEKGATHEGVLWASEEDQKKRFQMLLAPVERDFSGQDISINDLGCGYGAFFHFIKNHPAFEQGTFYGYDICADFIKAAQTKIHDPRAQFHHSNTALFEADYSFASGTFNLIGPQPIEDWTLYVKACLREFFKKTKKAMCFNLLDPETSMKEEWLFYADPDDFLTFCQKSLSPKTTISMNPELKGFTICVKR
ncbi:MAG: class I SAM-dependent methyltransferase [Methylocystaceae bacterium]|nr:class I SAM-dependent methyltransferase [Methylocystaceae bacterium]